MHLVALVLVFIVLVIYAIVQAIQNAWANRRRPDLEEAAMVARERYRSLLTGCYRDMAGTHLKRRFDGVDRNASMAVDEARGRLCLISTTTPRFQGLSVAASEIMSVKVVEDGTTVRETNTDRGSQIAGAVIGEMLGGRTGELIGGLSARRVTTSHKVSTWIELEIAVENMDYPLWHIVFSRDVLDKSSAEYLNRKDHARQWETALKVMMRQGSKKAPAKKVIPATEVIATPARIEPSYYVTREGQTVGPFSLSLIHQMTESGDLSLDQDFWYDAQGEAWHPLIDLPAGAARPR